MEFTVLTWVGGGWKGKDTDFGLGYRQVDDGEVGRTPQAEGMSLRGQGAFGG